jgi:hypothetical protein
MINELKAILEAEHMERIAIVNMALVAKDIRRPLAQLIGEIVDTHAEYFEQPIARIVYLQYFLAPMPGLFILFNDKGISFREIERQTGVSHNTVINWVRQSSTDLGTLSLD